MLLRAIVLAACLTPAAFAQPYTPRRTSYGQPDLQGLWGTTFFTPLERPAGVTSLVASPEQVRDLVRKADIEVLAQGIGLAVVKGETRTSWITKPDNGQIPFTEKALDLVVESYVMEEFGFTNPEDRPTYERCIAGKGQAPIRQVAGFVPSQITQTKSAVVIATEDAGGLRIVYLDGRKAPPDNLRTLEGWSSGRWDGNTLVVETTHTRADDIFRMHTGRPILVGPNSKVIERFTRVSENELLYQFTVEDSTYYRAPWSAEYSFGLAKGTGLMEYACHEGDKTLGNLLRSWRVYEEKNLVKVSAKPKAKAKARPKAKAKKRK